jgi:hypothetical protein
VRIVVHLHGDDVVRAAKVDEIGDVEAEGSDAVLVESRRPAVDEKPARLPQAVELQEDLPALGAGGELEVFAIPADAEKPFPLVAAAVADERAIGVGVVPGVRQADGGPGRVVEGGLLRAATSPKTNFQPASKL